ncbi:MAG: SH3 domain-containing protein [Clostridia bacterium]|nr:SH3 domain-containing protein [Clostridia bacterium]
MTKGRTCTPILLIIIIIGLLHVGCAEQGKIDTGGGTLNMRKTPEDKSKIVTRIKNGSNVEIIEHSNGWYHITYNGEEGYVKEEYVKLLSEAIGKEIYSNGDTLYLRESPDETASIVGMLNSQQAMKLEEINEKWVLVSTDSTKGYVQVLQIDNLSETPVKAATQKWEEGILQKETKLYKEPDSKSEVVSTWPKGTGVTVSTYDKKWCLVQVSDENAFGFALSSSISLSALPKVTDLVDDSTFTITASKAKKIAENALKQYSGFKASNYTCKQETMLSCDGIAGPLYRFAYMNKKDQVIYAAYVHCVTGEVLYKGDYSGFKYDQDIADLKTAPPSTTQEPGYVRIGGQVVWDSDVTTSTPIPGDDIGQSAARSIADRYLRAHYPRFSEMTFSKVTADYYADDPMVVGGFIEPYYIFSYYVADDLSYDDQLAYCIIINAFSGDIKSVSGPGEGAG